jgi:signal transduction histidine kinase
MAELRSDRWGRAIVLQAQVMTAVAVLMSIIWLFSGRGYFWPVWGWYGLGLALALQVVVRRAVVNHVGRYRVRPLLGGMLGVFALQDVVTWVLSGMGYFWPVWPILGYGCVLVALRPLSLGREAEQEALRRRVNVLTETRQGALDTQAAELRRIERDLHDGAQARLVSLGIHIGLAEDLLARDPGKAASLLAEARTANLAALEDLRSLVRGIHPPVLADRGLVGAIEALALDLVLPVTVTADLPGRPPAPVESALYFAVAECLANAVKHSGARVASVTIRYGDGRLTILVLDDGTGGADMSGGSGLPGIARRLASFDGTIAVDSPVGGPTIVTLEVPCALSSPRTSRSSGTD